MLLSGFFCDAKATAKFARTADFELAQDVGAVHIDGLVTDIQVATNFLAARTHDQLIKDLALSRRKFGQTGVVLAALAPVVMTFRSAAASLIDALDKVLRIERFLEKIEGAQLHGFYRTGNIAMRSQEYDGQVWPEFECLLEQLYSRKARHA